MKSQAYFDKIHKHIENNLKTSKTSIRIAVAWFTDTRLFNILCEKANEGIQVELLMANHEINHDSNIKYRDLINKGGQIFWIGKEGAYAPLMHNKFCIIDNTILIFGSYNWTQKAKSNHESITVIEEDYNLILDFNQEFDKIKDKYYNPNAEINWIKIVIRLETLLNVIKLEDLEDINYQIDKTKSLIPKNHSDKKIDTLSTILNHCSKKEFSQAVVLIQNFTGEFKKISIYNDPEIPALQLEIRSLEYQISSLSDEKTDIEKNIRSFELKYNEELGELITKILHYKKVVAEKIAKESREDKQKQQEYEEAKFDYEDFSKSYNDKLKEPKPLLLDEEKQNELKKNYRKATKLCHPDKVTDDQKELATKIFTDLKNAYDNNDLEKVNQILKDLEKGIFKSQGETIDEKDKLKIILENLIRKRNNLEEMLLSIKNTDAFNKINHIKNWDNYFEKTKEEFNKILEELENETTV
ncbi:phospholipase D-like domain-containing protein [Flavobacterium yafengii]|uniref:phospholipase D-like domain-containing protein n=1 Tax=Flavobacterium yafengii TaxID=3041253 RepID=UPI0024A8C806|nr:phospholipase D-like domain-containing protein [Flavobacterium yafengii]MDI5899069.1 phospholipase D-like domain-containing protein [Flavobacterium yafengii]